MPNAHAGTAGLGQLGGWPTPAAAASAALAQPHRDVGGLQRLLDDTGQVGANRFPGGNRVQIDGVLQPGAEYGDGS
jgi:hypothetical protein